MNKILKLMYGMFFYFFVHQEWKYKNRVIRLKRCKVYVEKENMLQAKIVICLTSG